MNFFFFFIKIIIFKNIMLEAPKLQWLSSQIWNSSSALFKKLIRDIQQKSHLRIWNKDTTYWCFFLETGKNSHCKRKK